MPLSNGEKSLVGKKVINVEQNTPNNSLTAVTSTFSWEGIIVKLHCCRTATVFLFF